MLPGQLCVLQATVLLVLPVHGTPPFLASRSIFLTPCLVPPPHVLVHSVHVPHAPQRQSTDNTKRMISVYSKTSFLDKFFGVAKLKMWNSSIPGQACSAQTLKSVDSPSHFAPPFWDCCSISRSLV